MKFADMPQQESCQHSYPHTENQDTHPHILSFCQWPLCSMCFTPQHLRHPTQTTMPDGCWKLPSRWQHKKKKVKIMKCKASQALSTIVTCVEPICQIKDPPTPESRGAVSFTPAVPPKSILISPLPGLGEWAVSVECSWQLG